MDFVVHTFPFPVAGCVEGEIDILSQIISADNQMALPDSGGWGGDGGGCRDGAGTSSSEVVNVLKETLDGKTVKNEEMEDSKSNDRVILSGGSASSSSCSSCLIKEPTPTTAMNGGSASPAKPMEGLHEIGPPPFLKKTYEMVEDPETDPVVSWSEARNSFVVWDSHQLSINLLPKYFKHCNFSSFIRQLNTYGFRKVNSGKWEFANEGFQRGKKHLLKNIKRRSRYNYNNKQHLSMAMTMEDLTKPVVETELETLKTDNNFLKVEILRLREQQQSSHNQLNMVEARARCVECKQQQLFSFLVKMSRNPAFFRQLVQKRMLGKKRRLLAMQGHENFGIDPIDTSSELAEMYPEVDELRPVEMPFEASIDNRSISSGAACMPPSTIFAENDMVVIDEELTANDSNFFMELEDLIKKPHDMIAPQVMYRNKFSLVV